MRSSLLGRIFSSCAFAAALFLFFACGRSSLEPETIDSGVVQPRACSASTCPTGCCDATGTCRTGSDVRACGAAGGRCADCIAQGFSVCTASRVCGRDVTRCDPSTCPGGCCSFEGGRQRCLAGNDGAACGTGGIACVDCESQGRACDPATHACSTAKCDPTTCKGCCVGNQCLPGTSATACGSGGKTCQSCASTGQTCQPTDIGGQCEGTANCGPLNCGGCCIGNTCETGTDSTACGKGGAVCANCAGMAPARVCVPDGQPLERTCQLPKCDATTCPKGCCFDNQCITSTTALHCGSGGAQCTTCPNNEICNAGTCTPRPCPATCGAGGTAECCLGGVCAVGTFDTQCGVGGEKCQSCGKGFVCQGGVCEKEACGPDNCPNGCCYQNVCVLGTQSFACGPAGGGACVDCEKDGLACNPTTRACVTPCSGANCNGCCKDGVTCIDPDNDTNCGSGGTTCVSCTGGTKCNKALTPHACSF